MKHYAIAEIDVTDPGWVGSYIRAVTPMIERLGGRYLARTSDVERIEGDRPAAQVTVIVEWPSREAAMAFYDSEEYRPYRESRIAGAINELTIIAGEDMTGAARIDG
jgi:uncharacterized protein (DUF1330 family)